MPTNTPGTSARAYTSAQVHYIDVPFGVAAGSNQILASQSVKVGTLPAGAVIKSVGVGMSVAYNAGTNNFVSFGTAAGGAQVAAAAAGPAVLGYTPLALTAIAALAADTDIYVNGAFTGTPPTVGAGMAFVEYYVPDSGLV